MDIETLLLMNQSLIQRIGNIADYEIPVGISITTSGNFILKFTTTKIVHCKTLEELKERYTDELKNVSLLK